MREQFEELEDISWRLDTGGLFWDENHKRYFGDSGSLAEYVNGAWYVYREKQKKIDSIKEKLTAICDDNTTIESLLDEIKELLE